MPNYKRLFIPNSYLFLTVTTNFRQKILIDNINILKLAFENTKKNYCFEIIAWVVLPDHFHLIIKPDNIEDYPKIIRSIKYSFSKQIEDGGIVIPPYELSQSKLNKGDKGIWQRRYYEHTLITEADLNAHIDYIHYNPVKHSCVKCVKDWEHSSFHDFVKEENYDINWGSFEDIKNIKELNYE